MRYDVLEALISLGPGDGRRFEGSDEFESGITGQDAGWEDDFVGQGGAHGAGYSPNKSEVPLEENAPQSIDPDSALNR